MKSTTKIDEGACYEAGQSCRVVKEYDPSAADKKMEVIYSLYRRHEVWSQDPARRRVEWWYLREGYCSVETFRRWLCRASRVDVDLGKETE